MSDEELKQLAKVMTAACVRNTILESYHSKGTPIGQDEMKAFMQEVVNRMYTFLKYMGTEDMAFTVVHGASSSSKWDEPKVVENMLVNIFEEL